MGWADGPRDLNTGGGGVGYGEGFDVVFASRMSIVESLRALLGID